MADKKDDTRLNLAQKIARVMGAVSRVPKSGYNKFHDYHYATEGDVADCVRTALSNEGVAIIPSTEKVEWRETPGGKQRIATVTVRYTITDGVDHLEAVFAGEGQDSGDKAIYKAYTGAHKYFLLRTFNISTGDEREPVEAHDPEREEEEQPREEKRPAPKRHEPKSGGEQADLPLDLATVKKKIDAAVEVTALRACVSLIERLPKNEQPEAISYYERRKKQLNTQDIVENVGRRVGQEG